jgi:predicted Zn-dependent protease
MISVREVLVIVLIVLIIFGYGWLSRAAAAAKVATKKRFWVNTPVKGEKEFTLMTTEKELTLGKQAHSAISKQWGLYEDDALQEYVQQVGLRVAGASEQPRGPWRFSVVDDAVPNAFAVPGGYIYITRGLLAYLCDEAELAGVLGHEIGHVTARHTAARYTRTQVAKAGLKLVRIIWPDTERTWGNWAAVKGLRLLFLSYGRDAELQADDLAVGYLARAGLDPSGWTRAVTTLSRVENARGKQIPNWLSTHPSSIDRATKLGQAVDRLKPRPTDAGRETYRLRIRGLKFGDGPSSQIDFDIVRDGDTWQSIATDTARGQIDTTALAIMNGQPVSTEPRVGEEIKVVVTGSRNVFRSFAR